MALVDCPECGRQVSTLAAACPQCGFPITREVVESQAPRRGRGPSRWTDLGFWIIVVGLAVVIIMGIVLLQHADDECEPGTTVPAAITQEAAGARPWPHPGPVVCGPMSPMGVALWSD